MTKGQSQDFLYGRLNYLFLCECHAGGRAIPGTGPDYLLMEYPEAGLQ
jgi:hypothetical protein